MLILIKNIPAILILSFFGYSKNNIQSRRVYTDSISTELFTTSLLQKSIGTVDLKFDSFFKKFESDRMFQLSRIQFPLKVISDTEGGQSVKSIKKSEWTYANFLKIKNVEIKKIIKTKNETDVKLSIIDTGVQVLHHFKIKNGQWWLCAITDQSD